MPRHETEGRFERAIRLANKHGIRKQVINAIYNKAWTSVFWFDDFDPVILVYDEVEDFSIGSHNSEDVEKILTLWQCLLTAAVSGEYDTTALKLQERANRLTAHLRVLSEQQDRPNNAANCKGLLIALVIMQAIGSEEQQRISIIEYGNLLCGSAHLGGFQFDRFVEILELMETPVGHLAEYDAVWESVLPIIEKRRGEAAVGDRLFTRGIAKLQNEQFIDGIELLGRALPNLTKEERKHRLVRCLSALAGAYSAIDLFWAAHSNLLSAVTMLMKEFERTHEIEPLLPMVFDKLFWIEVSVGRMPHAIWYLEMSVSTMRQADVENDLRREWEERARTQDAVLAMLLLKADREQIKHFTAMVPFFEDSGLYMCAMSLVFAFGGPEALRQHGFVPAEESDHSIWGFFKTLWNQPAQADLPTRIETFEGKTVTLISYAIGIKWEVECEPRRVSRRLFRLSPMPPMWSPQAGRSSAFRLRRAGCHGIPDSPVKSATQS